MQLPQFPIDLLFWCLEKKQHIPRCWPKKWWWIPWQKGKKQTPKKNSSKSKILECLECFADFFKEPAWWKFTPNSPRNKKKRLPPPRNTRPWNTTHETSSPPVVSFHTLVKNCTTSKSWKRHPVAWDVPGRTSGSVDGVNEWWNGINGLVSYKPQEIYHIIRGRWNIPIDPRNSDPNFRPGTSKVEMDGVWGWRCLTLTTN